MFRLLALCYAIYLLSLLLVKVSMCKCQSSKGLSGKHNNCVICMRACVGKVRGVCMPVYDYTLRTAYEAV